MSFIHLFLNADWIVKSVILGLILASLWSWTIIFSKIFILRMAQKEADIAIESFSESSLEKSEVHRFGQERPFSALVSLASQEWQRVNWAGGVSESQRISAQNLMLQRVEHMLSIHVDQQKEILSGQLGVLSSVGSMAPFVGLFGTVWGIMNSFQAIAVVENPSLAVVAPGLAEALFATAIGLVVAIPASIAYNRFNGAIYAYGVRMENFAQSVLVACMRPLNDVKVEQQRPYSF